jgi:acetylornithine deacetylase/succinyl-diaminopimelate desuccinylase-like protein
MSHRPGTAAPLLTLLLLLLGLSPGSATRAAAQPMPPQEYRDLARSIFSELIEINTSHSQGDNTAAARAMAKRLLDAGFPAEDVQVLVPADAPTKGNLVARYRGRDAGKPAVLLLAHIDVVEALPEDWTPGIDPFSFMERDGYYYGRGVTDDKDEAAIYTANLIRMKREGFVPEGDIIVALTADEEGGPRNGVDFILTEHRDVLGNVAYALNEGGGGMEKDGRKISNNVQASEKKFLSFQFEATNPGGHSSLPVKKNAIYDLSQALLAVQAYDFPVTLNEVTEAFFSRSADLVGGEMGRAMTRIVQNPGDATAAATLSAEPGYNSRLRTTCVATLLQGGHAQNALPQMARATVNCRILPDHDPEDVRARLQSLATPFDVTVTPTSTATPSPPSPLTEDVLGPIERITQEMWPGVKVLPVMSTGATDGLYLRRIGIPVYGVSGLFGDMDDVRAHGQDERISIENFYQGQEFLYRLVKALTGGGIA